MLTLWQTTERSQMTYQSTPIRVLQSKSVLVRMASLDFVCMAKGRSLIALRYTITSIVVLNLFINLEPSELNIGWLGTLVI